MSSGPPFPSVQRVRNVPSLRAILSSLDGQNRATRWKLVEHLGKIRRRRDRQGDDRWYLDFRPLGRIYSDRGVPFLTEGDAQRALCQIQGSVAKGNVSLQEALADFQPQWSKPNLVPTKLKAWLSVKRAEAQAGRLSPGYLRELERAADGYFAFFNRVSIYDWS